MVCGHEKNEIELEGASGRVRLGGDFVGFELVEGTHAERNDRDKAGKEGEPRIPESDARTGRGGAR